jgi:hypothetical protein
LGTQLLTLIAWWEEVIALRAKHEWYEPDCFDSIAGWALASKLRTGLLNIP